MHLLLFLAALISAAFGIVMLVFGGTRWLAPLAANPLVMAAVTWLLGSLLLVILGVIAARLRRLADALDVQRMPATLTTLVPSPPAVAPEPALPPEPAPFAEAVAAADPVAASLDETPPVTSPHAAMVPEPVAPRSPQPRDWLMQRDDAVASAETSYAPEPDRTVSPQPSTSPVEAERPAAPHDLLPDPALAVPAPIVGPDEPVTAMPFPPADAPVEAVAAPRLTAWPRVDPSDRIVPAKDYARPEPAPPVVAEHDFELHDFAPRAGGAPEVSIGRAPPPSAPPHLIKSGVVEGMAYTLYSDGSVEAELPVGIVHFASIAEWRAHMQAQT
jgi:hypothetical protein